MKNKTLKRLSKMAKPYWKTIISVIVLALLITACEMVRPILIQNVLDNYLPQRVFEHNNINIVIIGIFYAVLVILGNVISYINTNITNNMGENIVFNLRNKLYTFIEKSSIKFHDKTPSGKLFVRITSDTEEVYYLFNEVIKTFPRDIVLIIGTLIIMMVISIKLSMVNIVVVPLLLISTITFNMMMRKIYEKSKKVRTKLNTFLAESIYGIKLIKIFNRQKEKQIECEKNTKEFLDTIKYLGVLNSILPPLLKIIQNIGISMIVMICVDKWFGISLEVGVIYLFITYLKQLFNPIDRIIENVEIVEDALSSIDKVYEILEQEELIEDKESGIYLENIQGRIEFKNVWFAYDAKNWVLKDVSFVIEPGQSVALVGKTGSGKTTITNLINRFYEIQKGEILLDGVNIKDINLNCLRKSIGTILQDPFIFAKSIKDNIKLYNDISDDEINKAVQLASANEFIATLPNGINEIALERGGSYSAGQKQLIAFARIFAQNPAIFILDEATANIDTTTEQLIQKSVDKISEQKTSIFIAHRLSTIVNVDKIIVLNKGKIIEQGSHNELVKQNGHYAKLYNAYYNSLQ